MLIIFIKFLLKVQKQFFILIYKLDMMMPKSYMIFYQIVFNFYFKLAQKNSKLIKKKIIFKKKRNLIIN